MGYNLRGVASFDGTRFESGVNRMVNVANAGAAKIGQSFGSTITRRLGGAFALGAVATGFTTLALSGARYASSLKDLSEQHDMTTDEVQRIKELARQSGFEFEKYGQALSHFGDIRRRATEGDAKARKTLHSYGVELKDILDPTQRNITLMEKMGKTMSKMSLSAHQRSELKEIFGKSGDRIASSLGGLGSVRVPGMMSREEIEKIDKALKDYERLKITTQTTLGKGFGSARGLFAAFNDPNAEFRRQVAVAKAAEQAAADSKPSTVNGISDPAYFAMQAQYAETLNKLAEKGLEIEFERMGVEGKIAEIKKQIVALEIAAEEHRGLGGEDPTDPLEAARLEQEANIKRMEIENLRKMPRDRIGFQMTDRQSIGAFGGSVHDLIAINRQQVDYLKSIDQKIDKGGNGKNGIGIRVT